MNFIKTSDKDTAEKLKNLGFKMLSYDNGFYTFLNDMRKMTFEDIDKNKMIVTNSLFI